MNITYRNNKRAPKKFQQGGPVEAPVGEEPMPEEGMQEGAQEEEPMPEEGTPEGGGEQDPMMQLAQMFAQGLQNQDCQMLMQGAQMFLQLLQQSQDGGQPQEPQGEPVFRRGGRLAYRIRH
nr:MAG TPA: hypothetical protein [Caudoviricetes sp.]